MNTVIAYKRFLVDGWRCKTPQQIIHILEGFHQQGVDNEVWSTSLHHIGFRKDLDDVIVWYLEHGVDPNFHTHSGMSLLTDAIACRANLSVIQSFLNYGANPSSEVRYFRSPLSMAIFVEDSTDSVQVTRLLLEHGAYVGPSEIAYIRLANTGDIRIAEAVALIEQAYWVQNEDLIRCIQRKWKERCYHPSYIWRDGSTIGQRLFSVSVPA